jgi:hypothetical protein
MSLDDYDLSGVTELAAAVRSLAARMTVLERRTRIGAVGEVADLDEVDSETRRLVEEIERGEQASAALPQYLTGHPHVTLRDYEHATRDQAEHRSEALAASSTLASTGRFESSHSEAAKAFRTVSSKLVDLEQRIARLTEPARKARIQLDADDSRRRKAAPAIRRGDQAREDLHLRLDERISAAFKRGAIMPIWFDTALGPPTPPAEQTQEWMELAINVLAYRITYGIDHPILALGPEPPEEPEYRRDLYQDLKRRLSYLRD